MTGRRRLTRITGTVLAVGLTAALLAGCTGDEPGGKGPDAAATEGSARKDGPTSQELSDELFEAADARMRAPAVASGGGTFPNSGVELQVEVVSLERTDTGTVLTARFTGSGGFSGVELRKHLDLTVDFARRMYLVDENVTASRYFPLLFNDGRPACVCPGMQIDLGDDPQLVTATYPRLPDNVSAIDLVFNDVITVPDIPVTG